MENIHHRQNKIERDEKAIELKKELGVFWLLATHPQQTFSSNDILETIMEAGMMIHEKEFIQLLTSNLCRKAGLPFMHKNKDGSPRRFNNKFL